MMDLFKKRPKIVVINQSLNPVITRRIIMMDILVYKDILILKCQKTMPLPKHHIWEFRVSVF